LYHEQRHVIVLRGIACESIGGGKNGAEDILCGIRSGRFPRLESSALRPTPHLPPSYTNAFMCRISVARSTYPTRVMAVAAHTPAPDGTRRPNPFLEFPEYVAETIDAVEKFWCTRNWQEPHEPCRCLN
jgi:hypothetical protein